MDTKTICPQCLWLLWSSKQALSAGLVERFGQPHTHNEITEPHTTTVVVSSNQRERVCRFCIRGLGVEVGELGRGGGALRATALPSGAKFVLELKRARLPEIPTSSLIPISSVAGSVICRQLRDFQFLARFRGSISSPTAPANSLFTISRFSACPFPHEAFSHSRRHQTGTAPRSRTHGSRFPVRSCFRRRSSSRSPCRLLSRPIA
jgi:hypothetical protein